MEDQRFDTLVKRVASTSRRQVFGSLLGGLAAAVGLQESDAAKKDRKQGQKKRQQKKHAGKRRTKALRAQSGEDLVACPVPLNLGEPCPAKVGICHRTGSVTNPVRYIEVCVDAAPAHAAHGDLVDCPPNYVLDPETCTCVGDIINPGCQRPLVDCGGECVDPTTACGEGQVLNPETCECECGICPIEPKEHSCLSTCVCPVGATTCGLPGGVYPLNDRRCSSQGACFCATTVEGDALCTASGCGAPCTASTDCGPDEVCSLTAPCCPDPVTGEPVASRCQRHCLDNRGV